MLKEDGSGAMEPISRATEHFKRRRRREGPGRRRANNKNPISARLVLDHHLRGDVGILSDDLAIDLFPGSSVEGMALLLRSLFYHNLNQALALEIYFECSMELLY